MPQQEKRLQKAIKLAKQQGWRFKNEGKTNKHTKAFSPDGKTIVTIAASSRNRRGLENVLAEFRRGGLKGMRE